MTAPPPSIHMYPHHVMRGWVEMRFIVLKKSKQAPHLGFYGDRQMASRWRKHYPYWSGRYLLETKPDFRLVSNRYLPLSLPVAADHVGWLPVVHFCFSDTRINYWITVISYLKRARTGQRVLLHNCSLKLRISFSWFDAIDALVVYLCDKAWI